MSTLRLFTALACVHAVTLLGGFTPRPAAAASVCRAAMQRDLSLARRIDSVAALRSDGSAIALAGQRGGTVRFLPHDNLVLFSHAEQRGATTIRLPAYTTPPSVVMAPGTQQAYVLVDTRLLRVDTGAGRVRSQWSLDVQALGWPAAIAVASARRVYVAGQPGNGSPSAVVEALTTIPGKPARVLWRRALGLTHAGIWLAQAGGNRLAVYLPDAHDQAGSVELLDSHSGRPLSSYSVPGPPIASDPRAERLFVDVGGELRALKLADGAPVASDTTAASRGVPASTSVAVDRLRGVVAYVGSHGLVLASSSALRILAIMPVSAVTALAFTPNGSKLLIARQGELLLADFGPCFSR